MKNILLLAILFQACNPAPCQVDYTKASYDLLPTYNLSASDVGKVQLNAVTYDWHARFPKMVERYHAVGWPDAKIGLMTPGWAAWEDLIWGTSTKPFIVNGKPFISFSHASIHIDQSLKLSVTHALTRACGEYYGLNSHDAASGGTEIEIWTAQYVADTNTLVVPFLGPQRNILMPAIQSTTFGVDNFTMGYNEITKLHDLHFSADDGQWYVPGRLTIGSLGWDLGSNSSDGYLYGSQCDIAVLYIRGTPVNTTGPLTSMNCHIATVGMVGAALNTFAFNAGIETDDASLAVFSIPGFGGEGGGRGKFSLSKLETGTTTESRGPWMGTAVAYLYGQFCFDFGVIGYKAGTVHSDVLFILDPRLTDGSPQGSVLKFMVMESGSAYLIQDNLNHLLTPSPGEYVGADVLWDNTGAVRSNRTLTPIPCPSTVRLGFQRWNGTAFAPALDHTLGTPAYSYTGPQSGGGTTPPPCTWTKTGTGPCVNGKSLDAYSGSPAGCIGTAPVTYTTCAVAKPVKTLAKVIAPPKISNATNIAASRLVMKNATFTFGNNTVAWINPSTWINPNAGSNPPSGQLLTTGAVPLGVTITSNVKTSFDVTYPAPITPKYWIGSDLGTVTLSADTIKYY